MAMKKRGGKAARALEHQAKDLSPRRTRNVKGGETLQSSVLKKANEAGNGVLQKI
jgi:hypothetical protein